MLKFSGRLMEEKLKIGWTIDDFLSHLNVSEEVFVEYLKKNFSSKAFSQISKRLKTNQKRKNRQEKSKNSELSNTGGANMTSNETATTYDVAHIDIDSLKAQEKKLAENLCRMESIHAELVSKRATLKSTFQNLRKQLIDLTKELEEKKAIVDATYEEWLQISSEMHSMTKSISKERDLLSGIREEIKAAETISIFVYENGEIEVENSEPSTSSDEECCIFNELIQNELVESLTIKNIRQLSKLILLTQSIKQKGLKFEVTFESEILQEVFEQLN